MSQTLKQRIDSFIASETASRNDIVQALATKGVTAPDGMTVADVADLIRQIAFSDFEFFFNFKNIDQFGNPRKDRTGWATGGNFEFSGSLADTVVIMMSFNGDNILSKVCPVGAYGTSGYSPDGEVGVLSELILPGDDVSPYVIGFSDISDTAFHPDSSEWDPDFTNVHSTIQ